MAENSFQVEFIASHISRVNAVRTARPLLRAVSRLDRIELGLSRSNSMKRCTSAAANVPPPASKTARHPALARVDFQSSRYPPVLSGVNEMRWPTWISRAMFSARSM